MRSAAVTCTSSQRPIAPVQASHRDLLPQRVEPEKNEDEDGEDARGLSDVAGGTEPGMERAPGAQRRAPPGNRAARPP